MTRKEQINWIKKHMEAEYKKPHWADKYPILKWILIIIGGVILLFLAATQGMFLEEILNQ